MDCLYQKREELRAIIRQAQSDLTTIEAAIKVMQKPQNRREPLFKHGQLHRMVCDAMRKGETDNQDIARIVITEMGWQCTRSHLVNITKRVKDVTKRLKKTRASPVRQREGN